MNTRTYTIRAARLADFAARVGQLAKRATKLGVDVPTFAVVAEHDERVADPETGDALRDAAGGFVLERWFDVAVEHFLVKLPGWAFLATVQHTEAGNILRTVPGSDLADGELLRFRDRPSLCDHCKVLRRRNDTYLVRRASDREIVQVGSTCIDDFLGADALPQLELARDCGDLDEYEGSSGGGGRVDLWGTEHALGLVATAIRTVGWTSRKMAQESDLPATADVVMAVLTAWNEQARRAVQKRYPKVYDALKAGIPDEDKATAAGALAWARAIPKDVSSEYMSNLRTACSCNSTSGRELGIVASAVPGYLRELEREVQRRALPKATAGWLGAVGDKLGRKLSKKDKDAGASAHPVQLGAVVGLRAVDGDYGVTTITTIITDGGHCLKWFASGELPGIHLGDRVTVIGTVKKLESYQGRQETVLTRCELTHVAADQSVAA